MDYGALLQRSWQIVWNNKWLVLLGVLVALGSGGGGNGGGGGGSGGFDNNFNENDNFNFDENDFNPSEDLSGEEAQALGALLALGTTVAIALGCVIFIVVVCFGVVSRIATGGLIHAVDTIDGGGISSFGQAWSAGWARGWTLIGIGLVGVLPVLALVITLIGLAVAGGIGISGSLEDISAQAAAGGLTITAVGLICLFVPVIVLISLLQGLADRAAMLEGLGVFASYSRAWTVVTGNFGQAIILAIVHVLVNLGLGIALFGPRLAFVLCFCLFWPVLMLINGTITSYFSTLWTLAWRQWTGRTAVSGPAADVGPAV